MILPSICVPGSRRKQLITGVTRRAGSKVVAFLSAGR